MAIETDTKPAVELEHVQISLGKRTVLDDVTLAIQAGEFITILGPNGAGKSTLLKLLLGLIKPTAGKLQVLGRSPRRGNMDIGYVPQHRELETNLALRARDVVGFGLDGNRWGPGWPDRRRDARIDQALEEVDAAHLGRSPIGELSGGEQQRLLIAQALLTDPQLLLLDEPLSNLDISRGQEIVSLINRVCRTRKVTTLMVTHDINPLLNVVDRVIYVANGRCAVGTPDEVITNQTLSQLYGSSVEVIRAMGRMFVVGAEI